MLQNASKVLFINLIQDLACRQYAEWEDMLLQKLD